MMDNLTTTKDGRLLLQEDPGNQPHVAGIYEATPSDDHPVDPMRIMTFDPALFTPACPASSPRTRRAQASFRRPSSAGTPTCSPRRSTRRPTTR